MTADIAHQTTKNDATGRKCQWCGTRYHSAHPTKLFCTPKCKNDFGNFCASRGKVLLPIALAWRTQRGKKGVGSDALKEMTRFLDQCAAELSEQGAPPIAKHYSATRSSGNGVTHWADHQRARPSRVRPEHADQPAAQPE